MPITEMGHGAGAWLLPSVCWDTDQHCCRQLDMAAISLRPYLQESGSYAGLVSLGLLSVPILLQFLDI